MKFLYLFVVSFVFLFLCRKIAKKINLVDKPNERKVHQGEIPLIGGISIYLTLMLAFLMEPALIRQADSYIFCISTLLIVGVIDDKYDVDFRIRFVIQIAISCVMMFSAGLSLKSLGGLAFGQPLTLGVFGYVVTVFAVLGAINAFNMVDGIDGLLGGLSLATFGGLAYINYIDGQILLAKFSLLIMVIIVPYILFNIGFPFGIKRKVFMGDAGSMLIGFTVVWILLQGTQGSKAQMLPVTALWLIAIPLMDMVAIMVRRIRKGHSPFRPDREHLHHICLRAGLSSRQALFFICLLAFTFAGIGILLEMYKISEMVSLGLFLLLFAIYFLCINSIWRILAKFRKLHTS
ncbi:MAG: UDP-N-acetylglucosamine--undecaprenyl-phosphate N-acetylglucosaminephosphotransferase [Vibrionaceae bacterium]